MVRGIELFKQHFANFTAQYIVIGGTACDVNLNSANVPFRATRDLDVVLCLEVLDAVFLARMWDFIRNGRYATSQRSNGEPRFYRFSHPGNELYPFMIELFSRRPLDFNLVPGSQLTPVSVEDAASSLSAILLDDDYYGYIRASHTVIDGLSTVSVPALIVLKARAWMDLRQRKAKGESIDSADIRKHRNDIARLAPHLSPSENYTLPTTIAKDMNVFLAQYEKETVQPRQLGIPLNWQGILAALRHLCNGCS